MGYVIVDFDKIDPKQLTLLPGRENGFGGHSYDIRYGGKMLYVKYDKRKCRGGLVKWPNGGLTFGISLPDDDKYHWRAYEIDWHFSEDLGFGSIWSGIVSGDVFCTMNFSVPTDGDYTRTKFFGQTYAGIEGAIPIKSDIRVLALWDRVSVGNYGAVIRPKAVQVNVINLDQTDYDEDGPCVFYSEEVRRFNSPILLAP